MQEKGILLAVSALPSNYGVGDFGRCAYKFITLLEKHHFTLWQILPLNPISYGHSPYQPFSSYAFDELYVSIEDLYKKHLINKLPKPYKKQSKVYFELSKKRKEKIYRKAFKTFYKNKNNRKLLANFSLSNPRLLEFSKFITLHQINNDEEWSKWKITSLDNLQDEVNYHLFLQYELRLEWKKLLNFAHKHHVRIIGDVPFYSGYDSSDVYYHRDAFKLDQDSKMIVVAGVAPDYFSKTGQRWGNPIYDFDKLKENNYEFIVDRIGAQSEIYDIVRLDHFRAFDTHYEIPSSEETAINGEWIETDGYAIFDAFFSKYPNVEIIAEDLGELRNEVHQLREHYNFPGMNVLEFTFMDLYLRHNLEPYPFNSVTYIGTHDNKPLKAWYSSLDYESKKEINNFFNTHEEYKGKTIYQKFIDLALKENSKYVILTTQDLMMENGHHQINAPSTIDSRNWTYKLSSLSRLDRAIKCLELD